MTKTNTPVYTAVAFGQGYDQPQVLSATTNRQRAIDCADAALRSWFSSHSVLSEPEVWVEDENGVRVYEAWTVRRRVRHIATGEVRIETPVHQWHTEVARWKKKHGEAPFPMGHRLFENPADYGCEPLEPILNPLIVQN